MIVILNTDIGDIVANMHEGEIDQVLSFHPNKRIDQYKMIHGKYCIVTDLLLRIGDDDPTNYELVNYAIEIHSKMEYCRGKRIQHFPLEQIKIEKI